MTTESKSGESAFGALKKLGGKFGTRLAFEWGIEILHDELVEKFREYLAPITPDKVKEMVKKGEFPFADAEAFEALHGWVEHIQNIKADQVAEFLADARPDLAEALLEMGDEGFLYIVKLHKHILDLVMHPEKAPVVPPEVLEKKPTDLVKLTCDQCHQSWTAPRDEVAKTDKCPFCGLDKDEPAP